MRKPPRFDERLGAQRASQERTRERVAQMRPRVPIEKALRTQPPAVEMQRDGQSIAPPLPVPAAPISEPVLAPRLSRGSDHVALQLQPWTLKLMSCLLDRVQDRKIAIRLIWPAEIDALCSVHALANLSRVLQSDLVGLRTIYYPGTHATCAALDRILVDRGQLRALCQSLYETPPRRGSDSVMEVLAACNHVDAYNREVQSPQVRQLIPGFIYEPAQKKWADPKHPPIDRLISKVVKLRMRELFREKILPEWRSASAAPGALLVLPRGLKRKEVKHALANRANERLTTPADVLLLDACTRSGFADPQGVRRLPEFLKKLYEDCGTQIGALIVTDDPTGYFVLRHRLEQAGLHPDSGVLAAESEPHEGLMAPEAKTIDWQPANRTMINFSVTVLDQPAATLARRFGRIAEAVREEGSTVEETFRLAQAFVMRVSHIPGGFVDLQSSDTEAQRYLSRDLEWNRIEGLIRQTLTQGDATDQRQQIEDAIARVHRHLADCNEATPLALKLKEQVERFASGSKEGLTILLSSPRHVAIAQRFLARTLGNAWTEAQTRVDWLTLAQAPAQLKSRSSGRRLAIVGLSPRILRMIATHSEIPTGTCLLVPAQKALGVTQTLSGLATTETLKPYRARLSGLLATLKRCLSEIPDVEALTRSLENFTLPPARMSSSTSEGTDSSAYRFLLEDGRWVYAASMVFRYDGTEGGAGFKRVQARSIELGDLIFEMSDQLRDEIEQALTPAGALVESSPARKMLALYHSLVKNAVANLFPATSKQASLRAIKARMAEIDPKSSDVSLGKLSYWISLAADERTPHGARDPEEFQLFCRALEIEGGLAKTFWQWVVRVRFENQMEGRQLNAIYAEILFSPESAEVYRGLSHQIIDRLQTKALDCVVQVIDIQPPAG